VPDDEADEDEPRDRQDDSLLLASGNWGVRKIDL